MSSGSSFLKIGWSISSPTMIITSRSPISPSKDQYIEKDALINPKIEQMRLAATASLPSRRDVIVVASVSCIYGLGNPRTSRRWALRSMWGIISPAGRSSPDWWISFLRETISTSHPGRFRVKGDSIDLVPGYFNDIIRIELFGEGDRPLASPRWTGRRGRLKRSRGTSSSIRPGIMSFRRRSRKQLSRDSIMAELEHLPQAWNDRGPPAQAEDAARPGDDLRDGKLRKGIENYSRHFDRRLPGEAPYCLLDYFPG